VSEPCTGRRLWQLANGGLLRETFRHVSAEEYNWRRIVHTSLSQLGPTTSHGGFAVCSLVLRFSDKC
jgi:hypothetical protein